MSDIDDGPFVRFCSRCGGRLGVGVVGGRARPRCGVCGFVVYFDPKVACGVLVERAGCVLLVRRCHTVGHGLWCLPCGFEDADESPEQAACREAREEAGVEVVIDGVLGVYHYTDDPRGAGIFVVFRAHCCDDVVPVAGDDADAVGFFSLNELPPLSHHTHRRALDDWQRMRCGDGSG